MDTIALINSNDMKPPVAPIAIEYLAGALAAAGFGVEVIDCSFGEDPAGEIRRRLAAIDPLLVGISFRNTDDCFWPSGAWFVPRLGALVAAARAATSAPIVAGGCGFSIYPREILETCGADFGIAGDGEAPLLELAQRVARGEDCRTIPGLVYRDEAGRTVANPPEYADALSVSPARAWIDNARYLREGAMGNVETKRGCPAACIYCADPLAKGVRARCRPPGEIAGEFEALAAQGVDVLHLCDAEFNLPMPHALATAEELARRGLGRRVRWYCYAAIQPFTEQLAHAMRAAGCIGINFGADSACDRMLAVLGRAYRKEDVAAAVAACRAAGIAVMLDLLIGGPGEDESSARESIEFVKRAAPDCAGAAVGVRVYPGTRLAAFVRSQGPIAGNPNLRGAVTENENFFRPLFYVDWKLGPEPGALVARLIDRDARFFQPAAGDPTLDYNYNMNDVLAAAIARGERGAFWDILRRLRAKTGDAGKPGTVTGKPGTVTDLSVGMGGRSPGLG